MILYTTRRALGASAPNCVADETGGIPWHAVLDELGIVQTLSLVGIASEHNKYWRLYAVWCARQVRHLMTDPRSLAALNGATYYALGLITDAELAAYRRDAYAAAAADAAGAAGVAAAAAAAGAGAAAKLLARKKQTEKFRHMVTTGELPLA